MNTATFYVGQRFTVWHSLPYACWVFASSCIRFDFLLQVERMLLTSIDAVSTAGLVSGYPFYFPLGPSATPQIHCYTHFYSQ